MFLILQEYSFNFFSSWWKQDCSQQGWDGSMKVNSAWGLQGMRKKTALCSLRDHSFIKHLLSIYSEVGIEEGSGDVKINNKAVFLQRLKIVGRGSQENKCMLYGRDTALLHGERNILWMNYKVLKEESHLTGKWQTKFR